MLISVHQISDNSWHGGLNEDPLTYRISKPGNSTLSSVTFVKPKPRIGPGSFLKKRFTSSWARKRMVDGEEDGARGSFGLQLLHPSPEPLIDIIFVHGLRGGSTKTWRKGNDPRKFWPQLWLPVEPGLHNANIHSFGYDSDWASTKSSILSVHDFGQSLLEEMRNSSFLRDNGNGPIILIGHSMGGLVIKKAFILSRDIPEFHARIKCIFFLATPHRGSDYAAVLNNILTMSGIMSSRHYIEEITTDSRSAQLINDEFEKYANELPIFSFYETIQMKLGISSALVVEKSSAILGPGFRGERVQYLNANHRDMCKFETPDDPNYVTLKNALTSAIQDISKDVIQTKTKDSKEQMKVLRSFLGISDQPYEQYVELEGSCQWIDSREDFQDWRDPAVQLLQNESTARKKNPSIYWVYANPGTGKTFLASHIKDELGQFQLECAHYFFHVGNKSSLSLSDFLRSVAYQMGANNAFIRKELIGLCEEGSAFDKDDAAIIWMKIFKKAIFQARVYTPQYWVIDAIDECGKYQEFFTMIKGIQLSFPLRIFITSRKIPGMHRIYRHLEGSVSITCVEISADDSIRDIENYIQDRGKHLSNNFVSGEEDIAAILLRKSNACFLWVKLVLDELEKVYTKESIMQVLESIPEGMVPYYERTIRGMAENRLEKHVAKAILMWAVATSRKLFIHELSNALKLDINTILPSAKSAVEGLCGQFVTVEHESGLVDLVHPTAREFLLSEAAGEFYISKPKAHERIALTCLQLLSSAEMKSPRTRRMLPHTRKQEVSPLTEYAVTQFSEHIYSASAETDEVLLALDLFFKTNILSWINAIAQKGDVHPLIRVSKNLKGYLDRIAKYRSPLSSQVQNIDQWSVDLSRIATKFGIAILENPQSIYFTIPPFCPSGSAIYQQFAKRLGPSGLSIVGHIKNAWDDCIASVDFGQDSIAAAISCGENLIAVGMASGEIILFNRKSCQKEGVIQQKDHIDLVHFTDKSLAVSTTRSIILMDREGNIIWQNRSRRCILLTSSGNALISVTRSGRVLQWDISTGALLEDKACLYRSPTDDGYGSSTMKAACVASLSPDMETLALGYYWGALCIFEVHGGEPIAWACDTTSKLTSVVMFNPNPNTCLLLVILRDHKLALYDKVALYEGDTGALVRTQTSNTILSACGSPDGRTLATVDCQGILQIWDFESLNLLYRVLTPSASFRILSFLSDGSGVVDVVDSSMRVWTPAILVRKNIDEDQRNSGEALNLAVIEGEYETLKVSRITALGAHPSQSMVFAGEHHGRITAFDTKTGKQSAELYTHSHSAFITQVAVSKGGLIASSDVHSVVQVWDLKSGLLSPLRLYTYSKGHVKHLCFSSSGDYLLVARSQSDQVYLMDDGSCVGELRFGPNERKTWRWLAVPSTRKEVERFALIQNRTLAFFSTQAFPSTLEECGVSLHYELCNGSKEIDIDSAVIDPETKILVLSIRHISGYVTPSTMFLFDLKKLPSPIHAPSPILSPLSDVLSNCCRSFVGLSERTHSLVFLHQNSWLCSVDLRSPALIQFRQHFFVPNEYVAVIHDLLPVMPVMTAADDVVFCLHGELVVVKNGLSFGDPKTLE